MAVTPNTLADEQARVFGILVNNARKELRRVVGLLDGASPETARNVLLEVMPELTRKYGEAASEAALGWYADLRDGAGVTGPYLDDWVPLDQDALTRATRRAAGSLWDGSTLDLLTSLDAIVDLHVKRMGRDTMTRTAIGDPRARGWHRIHRGDTCGFCLMLESRGGVYTRATADFAAHHDCDCVAGPSFDPDAPQVTARQYIVSQRTAAMDPEQRAAHNARARGWIDDYLTTGALA